MDYSPVTRERIQQALTSLGMAFRQDEKENIIVSLEEVICVFGVFDDHFAGLANWRGGAANEEDGYQLRQVINEVNKKVPTMRTHARKAGEWVLPQGMVTFPTSCGVSDEQLRRMLDRFFASVHEMAALLSEFAGHLKIDASEKNGEDS